MTRGSLSAILVALAIVLASAPAHAQSRTYVSTKGSDGNDCFGPATACATFPRAISQATAKGTVLCVDSGFFGALNITFSITIQCESNFGETGFNFNSVNIGPNDRVDINGVIMDMRGFAGGSAALSYTGSGSLVVRNSTIRASGTGISVTTNGAAKLLVANTTIEHNTGVGLLIQPTAGAVQAEIDGLRAAGNLGGVQALAGTGATIDLQLRNSVISQNSNFGVVSQSNGGVTSSFVDRSAISQNASIGLYASGTNAYLLVNGTTIERNNIGWAFGSGGQLVSYGNNVVNSASSFGGPSATISLQ